ncbi:MAG: hypothetical protein ABIT83_21615 [Massilia sp.]
MLPARGPPHARPCLWRPGALREQTCAGAWPGMIVAPPPSAPLRFAPWAAQLVHGMAPIVRFLQLKPIAKLCAGSPAG